MTGATLQAQPAADWQAPTTYAQRFTEAVALLCREPPPADMVAGWIDRASDDHRLQDWACERAPAWAQGIGLLDAAHVMADQPTEGVDHEPAPQQATPAPVGKAPIWNSIQIASWIGSQLMHEPAMFERATVCKFVRALGRHPTLLKHSPKDHVPAPGVPEGFSLAQAEFNRAIDFAIKEGIGAAIFLDAWRRGDTSEWPEFAAQAKHSPTKDQPTAEKGNHD